MRLAKRVIVLSLLLLGTVVTGIASAQTPPCRDNGTTSPYAGAKSGLATDKAQARVGDLVTLRGCGYRGASQVAHTMNSHPIALGSATTDANGDYTFQFTVPADAHVGDHTITATGVNPNGAPRVQTVSFTVLAAQTATTTTVAGEAARTTATTTAAAAAGSTLPRTGGGSTMPQVVGGVALVGIGAALVVIARRRRSATTA